MVKGLGLILYGIKINTDTNLIYDFDVQTSYKYELTLQQTPPQTLKEAITCGFKLYQAHGRKVYLYSNQEFDAYLPNQPWCYEVDGIVKFYWYSNHKTIYYEKLDHFTDQLLGFWFTHLMLPFFMALERFYEIIHAGAVEINNKAVLFIAPSMGGKSTTTDFFIKQNHTLISDDKVSTFFEQNKLYAVGSHPYHRPYRKFEELGYRVDNFTTSFKPIHAIYQLKKTIPTDTITIKEINGFEKFNTLLPNYLFSFPWTKAQRMKNLTDILNSVKVFEITIPWDKQRLIEVYEKICEHSQNI